MGGLGLGPVVAGLLAQFLPGPTTTPFCGLAALPVGTALVVGAVSAGSLVLFLAGAGAVVGGAGIGLAFQSAVSRVAQLARDDDRGAVTSTFFVAAYLGITVPVVGVGELATATGLLTAAIALAAPVAVLAVAGAVLTADAGIPRAGIDRGVGG